MFCANTCTPSFPTGCNLPVLPLTTISNVPPAAVPYMIERKNINVSRQKGENKETNIGTNRTPPRYVLQWKKQSFVARHLQYCCTCATVIFLAKVNSFEVKLNKIQLLYSFQIQIPLPLLPKRMLDRSLMITHQYWQLESHGLNCDSSKTLTSSLQYAAVKNLPTMKATY